eukprot:RCo013418
MAGAAAGTGALVRLLLWAAWGLLGCHGDRLYVTLHGGASTAHSKVNNILSFDLTTGHALGPVLLHPPGVPLSMLRGIAVDPDTNRLFVANSNFQDSKVLEFAPCSRHNHSRVFVRELASHRRTPEILHPYGLILGPLPYSSDRKDRGQALYVSSQDTEEVVSFDTTWGSPTLVLHKDLGLTRVRSLTMDPCHNLYVATGEGVAVFDVYSTHRPVRRATLPLRDVIRVYIRQEEWEGTRGSFLVFASSRADDTVHSWAGTCAV